MTLSKVSVELKITGVILILLLSTLPGVNVISSAAEGILSYTRLRDNVCGTPDTSPISAILKLPPVLTAPPIVYVIPTVASSVHISLVLFGMEPKIPPIRLIPPEHTDGLAT